MKLTKPWRRKMEQKRQAREVALEQARSEVRRNGAKEIIDMYNIKPLYDSDLGSKDKHIRVSGEEFRRLLFELKPDTVMLLGLYHPDPFAQSTGARMYLEYGFAVEADARSSDLFEGTDWEQRNQVAKITWPVTV